MPLVKNRKAGTLSLNHDFLLLDRDIDGEWALTRFIDDARSIHLHDDLLRYMGDTLAWIPTFNPARREAHLGFCWWGSTVIGVEGAATAERVFRAWAELFSLGPPVLALTGAFSWVEEDHVPLPGGLERAESLAKGAYSKLEFDRDEVVSVLRQLAEYASHVRSTDGRCYILHNGV